MAQENSARGFFLRMLLAQQLLRNDGGLFFWVSFLIDYGVRLKPDADTPVRFRGNDCKFVESNISNVIDTHSGTFSAQDFLDAIRNWADTTLGLDLNASVRVLACVR